MSAVVAATTYDIVDLCVTVSRLYRKIWIISLLQPPPETVALFDELILVNKGEILYSGPVSEAESHFSSLGYALPERMDMADWLQVRWSGRQHSIDVTQARRRSAHTHVFDDLLRP